MSDEKLETLIEEVSKAIDKKEDYSDINIGLGSICDDDSSPEDPKDWRIKDLEMENESLRGALEQKTKENELNHGALQMLIKICKEQKFDPFPGEDFPFKKPIQDLTREELIAKNKVATAHIEKTRGVNSKDKTQMPPAHVLEGKYASETPTFSESMEELLSKLEVQAIPDPRTVSPFERKIIHASSGEPYDPYSGS